MKKFLFRELSTKAFVISQILILLTGLFIFISLALFVNDAPGKGPWQLRQPVTQEPKSFSLTINSPEDNLLVFEPTLLISGKTSPKTTLVISSPSQDYALLSLDNGDFSKSVVLKAGLNIITINAISDDGVIKQIKKIAYYSKEKI